MPKYKLSCNKPDGLASAGLPEAWSQDGGVGVFGGGAFSLDGIFPVVEPNVQLIKGLFSDSLPPFLRMEVPPVANFPHPIPSPSMSVL